MPCSRLTLVPLLPIFASPTTSLHFLTYCLGESLQHVCFFKKRKCTSLSIPNSVDHQPAAHEVYYGWCVSLLSRRTVHGLRDVCQAHFASSRRSSPRTSPKFPCKGHRRLLRSFLICWPMPRSTRSQSRWLYTASSYLHLWAMYL